MKLFLILGSPEFTFDSIALTPLSSKNTSSFSTKAEAFLNITSTFVVPFLDKTCAAAPELLPTPISPTITSVLSPLGPLYEPKVMFGIAALPVPDDSNTATMFTTSGTSRDISLSCTLLPNIPLGVRPSPTPVDIPELVLLDPVITFVASLISVFCFDFTFDFCCVLCTTTED